MGSLSRLPVEILLMIFKRLCNIDDLLHLARSCKTLYSIFNEPRHRLAAFKSIIRTSPQHKHDLQLCLLQDVLQSLPYKPNSTRSSPNSPNPQSWTSILKGLSEGSDFTDSMIWKTVCRWHAMKILFYLYCDPLIRHSYIRSAFLDESHDVEKIRMTEKILMTKDHVPNPSTSCLMADQIETTHYKKAYQRFYQALTAHWVATETLCIARGANYETSNECLECFAYAWALRVDNPGRALAEKMDVLEVVDFVWGYLGRKVFQGENAISDWIDDPGYLEPLFEDSPGPPWLYFLLQITQYLRPPHIIELLLLLTWVEPQACAIRSKSSYLSQLGFPPDESRVFDGGGGSPETFVPVHVVDEDVVNSLTKSWSNASQVDAQDAWEKYRGGRWNSDAKGRLLFDELSSAQWVQRIANE